MKVTNATLFRLAGLSALIGGLCYVLVGIGHPANVPASVTSASWGTIHVVACVMSFFGVLGLAGIYARQAAKAGWIGLVGYVLLTFWMVLIAGFSFVEAFVLPQISSTSPDFIDGWMKVFNGGDAAVSMGALPALWTISAPAYMLGGLLFGIGTFRAHVLPRGGAVLLALGTVLAPLAAALPLSAQPKMAIPMGLGLAWLGYGLMVERRTPATVPADQEISVTV